MTTAVLSRGFNGDNVAASVTATLRGLAGRSAFPRVWSGQLADAGKAKGEFGRKWVTAEKQIAAIGNLTLGWDSYGGVAPNAATIAYAVSMLNALKAMDLPPPVVSPSGAGEILAAWSAKGIDVEVWFQAPNEETVLIDDELGVILPTSGADPFLKNAVRALREMHKRK